MAESALIATIVGATAAVGGTAKSIKEGRKAERASEEQARISKARANAQNSRNRRQQVAQARRARAATIAQGEASGISGGSQVQGALTSLDSQLNTNQAFSNQLTDLDNASFAAGASFNSATASANKAQNIGSTIASTSFAVGSAFD